MGLIASKVAQQFYGKADIASLALHFYQADVIKRGVGGPSSLTEAQRTSFPQALYRLYTHDKLGRLGERSTTLRPVGFFRSSGDRADDESAALVDALLPQ